MKKIATLIVLLFLMQSLAFTQNWLWGTSISGNDLLGSEALGIDSANNIYLLSELNGTAVVQGVTVSSSGDKDIQLSKFDINGNLQWTRTMGGTTEDDPKGLYTDKKGNSYITGSIAGTADFNGITLNLQDTKDAYLAKYDASGNVSWAKVIAWGENIEKGTSVNVGPSGYITVGGLFLDTIIFGDTVGAVNCDTLVAKKNAKNYFLAKFDNNGDYIYSKQIYTNNKKIALDAVALYDGENCYMGGDFTDSLFVDTDTLVAYDHGRDIAIINFDAMGNVVWAKRFSGVGIDRLHGIESDEFNNIYITGNFKDTLILDNDTLIGANATTYDLFIAKLDSSGNVLWAIAKGDVSNDFGWSVTYRDNKLQMSGSFRGTIVWGNDTISSTSTSDLDAFFATFDVTTGSLINIVKVDVDSSSAANDEPRDIVVDNFGNTYMAGRYKSDSLYFGNDTVVNANPGQYDVFLAKYGCQEVFLNFTVDTVTCPGMNDGAATVTPTIARTYDYLWSTGDTTSTADSLSEGTYTVTLSTDWGCAYSDSVNVTHYPSLTTYLDEDTVVLDCMTDTNGVDIVTPVNGVDSGYTYKWDTGILDSMVTNLDTGIHYVTVTDYCGSVVDSVIVTNKTPLSITTAMVQEVTCPSDSDGVAQVTTSDGIRPFSYAWTNSSDTDSLASDLPVGMIYVSVTDQCGTVVDSVAMTNKTPLSITYKTTDVNCYGDSTGKILIIASDGVTPYNYNWSNDTTVHDSVATGLAAGTYLVTITDACGSIDTTILLTQNDKISFLADITNASTNLSTDGEIDLSVQGGTSPYTYLWSNSAVTEDLTALSYGVYSVTVTDINGCAATDTMKVEPNGYKIIIYSSFSPNADGVNDLWNIKNIEYFPDCKVQIFNEWGNLVFTSNGYGTPWDGTSNGSVLPAGTYYYIIDLGTGDKPFTGPVTLIK